MRVADDVIYWCAGKVHHISPEHPFHKAILRLTDQGAHEAALKLCDPREVIAGAASAVFGEVGSTLMLSMVGPTAEPSITTSLSVEAGDVVGQDQPAIKVTVDSAGDLRINGRCPDPVFSRVLIDRLMHPEGKQPIDDMVKFYLRLCRNPGGQPVQAALFSFLARGRYPILPDGRIMAYKGLFKTEDPTRFTSHHDRTFEYELGAKLRVSRGDCDLNLKTDCGPGLHIGTLEYAKHYGDTFCEVIVDPIDVIRVPDATTKMACCALTLYRVQPHDHPVEPSTYWSRLDEILPVDPEPTSVTGVPSAWDTGEDDREDEDEDDNEDYEDEEDDDEEDDNRDYEDEDADYEGEDDDGDDGDDGTGGRTVPPSPQRIVAGPPAVAVPGPAAVPPVGTSAQETLDRRAREQVAAEARWADTPGAQAEAQVATLTVPVSVVPARPAKAPRKGKKRGSEGKKKSRKPSSKRPVRGQRTYYRLSNKGSNGKYRSIEAKRCAAHPGGAWSSHRARLQATLDAN